MLRKPRKLPGLTIDEPALECGTRPDRDAGRCGGEGAGSALLDDLLATGGTMSRHQPAAPGRHRVPCAAALIELTFLEGRKRIDTAFEALVAYDAHGRDGEVESPKSLKHAIKQKVGA